MERENLRLELQNHQIELEILNVEDTKEEKNCTTENNTEIEDEEGGRNENNSFQECPFPCEDPSIEDRSADELYAHLTLHHKEELDNNFSVGIESFVRKLKRKVTMKCSYGCSYKEYKTHKLKEYKTFALLQTHYRTAHTMDATVCDHCGVSFDNVFKLKNHLGNLKSRNEKVRCKKCGNYFSKYDLSDHIKMKHTGPEKYKCSESNCQKSFGKRYLLGIHTRTVHEMLKPFKCDKCGKAMSRFPNLSDHRGQMHGEKYPSIHFYREMIASGSHPFVEREDCDL